MENSWYSWSTLLYNYKFIVVVGINFEKGCGGVSILLSSKRVQEEPFLLTL
jgi:hypothetical protein